MVTESVNKPLVTIALMTYNQEKYVREAIGGILAQTYEPLEILISDDASTDNTWQIVTDTLAEYRSSDGVHKNIILNRNPKNAGISAHFQKLTTLVHGKIVVTCGGDDISLSTRVSEIVSAMTRDSSVKVLLHRFLAIDHDGNDTQCPWEDGYRLYGRCAGSLGAAMAYSSDVFTAFPKIFVKRAGEDNIYARRAMLLGRGLEINDRLVKYRLDSGISRSDNNARLRILTMILKAAVQTYFDVRYARAHSLPGEIDVVRGMVDNDFRRYWNEWLWLKYGGVLRIVRIGLYPIVLALRPLRMRRKMRTTKA